MTWSLSASDEPFGSSFWFITWYRPFESSVYLGSSVDHTRQWITLVSGSYSSVDHTRQWIILVSGSHSGSSWESGLSRPDTPSCPPQYNIVNRKLTMLYSIINQVREKHKVLFFFFFFRPVYCMGLWPNVFPLYKHILSHLMSLSPTLQTCSPCSNIKHETQIVPFKFCHRSILARWLLVQNFPVYLFAPWHCAISTSSFLQ